jgi:hypothetical protein
MNNFSGLTGTLYFLTDTVVDWIDIFTRPTCKHIILESLRIAIPNGRGNLRKSA